MALYKPRDIDLNLFVNAESKGFQDGSKVPSPFAAFVGAFTQGIDDSQKYAVQEQQMQERDQQMEQRQIQIDNAPVQARIEEAKAVRAEADANVIQSNPQLYQDTQVADLKLKAAQTQQQSIIQTKKTDLLSIWNGQDAAAKAEAANSGKFDDLFAQDKSLKDQYVKATYKDWTDDGRALYDQVQANDRKKQWSIEALGTITKQYPDYEKDYFSNQDISNIKQKIGGNVSDPDLLEKGHMDFVTAPPSMPLQIKDSKGVFVNKTDDNGFTVTVPNLTAEPVKKRVFVYDGKMYDTGSESGNGLSDRTNQIFSTYKNAYSLKYGIAQGTDGIGDLKKSAQDKKDVETKKNAEAEMQYQTSATELQTSQDAFFKGAQIDPQYPTAASRYQTVGQPQVEEATPPGALPDLTPSSTFVPVTPPGMERTPEPARTATAEPTKTSTPKPTIAGTPLAGSVPAPVVTPAFTVTPGTASPLAMSGKASSSEPVSKPTLSPDEQQAQIKKQMIQSKAEQALSKYQKTNSPVPSVPTPVDQARAVTSSSYVPTKMQVNVPSNRGPDSQAINRVSNNPVLQNSSAIVKAVIAHESRGIGNAESPTGVKGLAQVTQANMKDISKEVGRPLDRTNDADSALAGTILLERQLANPAFANNPMLALTSYNSGPEVVIRAIKLAKSTDWNVVKEFIAPAVRSLDSTWKRMGVDTEQKARESRQYAENVVVNFPSFVYTRSDMDLADQLKQQKVLSF